MPDCTCSYHVANSGVPRHADGCPRVVPTVDPVRLRRRLLTAEGAQAFLTAPALSGTPGRRTVRNLSAAAQTFVDAPTARHLSSTDVEEVLDVVVAQMTPSISGTVAPGIIDTAASLVIEQLETLLARLEVVDQSVYGRLDELETRIEVLTARLPVVAAETINAQSAADEDLDELSARVIDVLGPRLMAEIDAAVPVAVQHYEGRER